MKLHENGVLLELEQLGIGAELVGGVDFIQRNVLAVANVAIQVEVSVPDVVFDTGKKVDIEIVGSVLQRSPLYDTCPLQTLTLNASNFEADSVYRQSFIVATNGLGSITIGKITSTLDTVLNDVTVRFGLIREV
jgi:hypothetical protein